MRGGWDAAPPGSTRKGWAVLTNTSFACPAHPSRCGCLRTQPASRAAGGGQAVRALAPDPVQPTGHRGLQARVLDRVRELGADLELRGQVAADLIALRLHRVGAGLLRAALAQPLAQLPRPGARR